MKSLLILLALIGMMDCQRNKGLRPKGMNCGYFVPMNNETDTRAECQAEDQDGAVRIDGKGFRKDQDVIGEVRKFGHYSIKVGKNNLILEITTFYCTVNDFPLHENQICFDSNKKIQFLF